MRRGGAMRRGGRGGQRRRGVLFEAALSGAALAGAALGGAALALVGCAGATRAPVAPREAPMSREALERLVADVQAIRGLRAMRPISIEQLDERRFSEAIDERQAPPSLQGLDRMQAALSFGGGGQRAAQQEQRILHEQLLGFYEQGSDKVFLRDGAAGSGETARLTLAHEVQHALQDQHFGTLGLGALLDEDARLSRLALLEGDATVTGVAYLAAQSDAPLRRAMVRLARSTRFAATDQVIGGSGKELEGAPAIDRERLAFPYVAGTGFAAELHRAGGFPLLDRALRSPPDTTEQVLHPERYVAGEQAIPVRAPLPPAGYVAIATGRMGELQTRALLLSCVGWDRASRAAEGWGGDAFTVIAAAGSGPGSRAALWSTAWDTERDAVEFEQALAESGACLPALAQEGAAAAAGTSVKLVRRGSHVALVVGLPPDRLGAAAEVLLELPEPPLPAAPPVGEAVILPLPPALQASPGVLQGSSYTSAWLGLSAEVPRGFKGVVAREGAELFVQRAGAMGLLAVSDRQVNERSTERLFVEVAQGFTKGSGLALRALGPTTWTTLPIGTAALRRWAAVGTPLEAAAFMAPICEGAGALVLMTAWAGAEEKAAVDGWLMSLRATTAAAPICSELNPR